MMLEGPVFRQRQVPRRQRLASVYSRRHGYIIRCCRPRLGLFHYRPEVMEREYTDAIFVYDSC